MAGYIAEHCLQLHWLLDFEKSVASLLGHTLQVMMRQPKPQLTNTPQEKECLDWLQSPLLKNVHQPKAFLDSEFQGLLSALQEDSHSRVRQYHLQMKDKVSKGRPTLLSRLQLQPEESGEIDRLYAFFLSTLLKHCSQLATLKSSMEKIMRLSEGDIQHEGETEGEAEGDADGGDGEDEDQIGELGDTRGHAKTDSLVSHKSLWRFSLKFLDWLGQRRQEMKSQVDGDETAASKQFLAFLSQVRGRILFVFELSPMLLDLDQPSSSSSSTSVVTSATSHLLTGSPRSPRTRSSSFDASSLSPQIQPLLTAQGIRRSASSYNHSKTLGKKKISPSLVLAQQIVILFPLLDYYYYYSFLLSSNLHFSFSFSSLIRKWTRTNWAK